MPAHVTAVGKAVLAHSPHARFDAVVAAGPARLTPRTIVAPGLLARELRRMREHGVAEDHEQGVVGVACVAAVVLGRSGHAVAALSVTGGAGLDVTLLASAIRTAALGLSRSLRGAESATS